MDRPYDVSILMKYFLNVCLLLCGTTLFAQQYFSELTLSSATLQANEPAIAIHPTDSSKIIVATNVNNIFWSHNAGKSFKHYKATSSHGVYGDPVLLYTPTGQLFYAHLSKYDNYKWPDFFKAIIIQPGIDDGKNFYDGYAVGYHPTKMQDKPAMSYNHITGLIHMSWTEFDKYESDNAQDSTRIYFATFNPSTFNIVGPIQVNDKNGNCADDDETVEGATTIITTKGIIGMAWAGHQHIYFDKSIDSGKTWGRDQIVDRIEEGWNLETKGFMRTSGLPYLNCDTNDNLYITTVSNYTAKQSITVYYKHLSDSIWRKHIISSPIMEADCIMPHTFFDKLTNRLYIIYYVVADGKLAVYLSFSSNNQMQWKTIRVSYTDSPLPGDKLFFGDYIAVAARNKTIVTAWTEIKNALPVVKFRKILLD